MISFKYGTQEQFDSQVKDNSALYFISDTKRIYRGEEQIAGVEAIFVDELPCFKLAIEDVIYVLVEGDFPKLYVKGETDLVPISGEVASQSIKNIDAFNPDMILTTSDDIENADDNTLITSGAVKELVERSTGTWEYLDGTEDSSKVYG